MKLIQITQGVINRHPNSYEAPLARSVRLALRDLPLLKHDEGSVVHSCPTWQSQKKTGAFQNYSQRQSHLNVPVYITDRILFPSYPLCFTYN